MQYFLQHGAGLHSLVLDALMNDLPDFEIDYHDDSSVLIRSRGGMRDLAQRPYVKNAFEIIAEIPRVALPVALGTLASVLASTYGMPKERPFRLMASIDGKLVGLPRPRRENLESVIRSRTGGYVEARGGTGEEYWIIGRRELSTFIFGRRLRAGGKQKPARGSLAPELSALLVLAADPTPDGVFLDPFAGSGSLVQARLMLPVRRVVCSDLDLAQIPPELRRNRLVRISAEDARDLASVSDGSVTEIVTDPPWGEHQSVGEPYPDFARAVLRSFARVLDPRAGRLVVLLSRRSNAEVAPIWRECGLQCDASHDILVNGHPATAAVGRRA